MDCLSDDWQSAGTNCEAWTSNADVLGETGNAKANDVSFINRRSPVACADVSQHLICVQQ